MSSVLARNKSYYGKILPSSLPPSTLWENDCHHSVIDAVYEGMPRMLNHVKPLSDPSMGNRWVRAPQQWVVKNDSRYALEGTYLGVQECQLITMLLGNRPVLQIASGRGRGDPESSIIDSKRGKQSWHSNGNKMVFLSGKPTMGGRGTQIDA